MIAGNVSSTAVLTEQQVKLLQLIESVMIEYVKWREVCILMQVQILYDFKRPNPNQELVCDWIEDWQVFAMALQDIAERIRREADEVTDQFYMWLVD